jgi:nucleotide-binding universal stress UspA family protein
MVEFKRILVPLDGSPLSERALPVAMALADRFESQVILLRALNISVQAIPIYDPGASAQISETFERLRQEAESYLLIQEGRLCQQGIGARIILDNHSPAESIITAATTEDVDLIVMSTHGHGGLARWAYGSVADKVARHSPCPVLLVRQKPEGTLEGYQFEVGRASIHDSASLRGKPENESSQDRKMNAMKRSQ